MQFLKKNYEKILLGLVLVGLIGALVFMPFFIGSENDRMRESVDGIIKKPATELPALDTTTQDGAVARLRTTSTLDLESTNRVFNPMEWVKLPDGNLGRANTHRGPLMVTVTNITPLYLVVSLDSVMTNELGVRYVVGVEKQYDSNPAKRRKQQRYLSVGDKPNDICSLVSVTGAPENPEAITIKLVDGGETITCGLNKPFRRVDAYMADFRYEPENKSFRNKRAGDRVTFDGTEYLVDGVSQSELILQDTTNQKKTSRPLAL